jgi:SAM-dependent methyltransferase
MPSIRFESWNTKRVAKTPFDDYLKEITFQRAVWQKKPVLREHYLHCYAKIVAALSALKPTIEIGSGSGNFKEYYPECISTDVFKSGPWIDRIVDAQSLPFGPGEAGNLVVFDVIHHLQRPLNFLRQASTALKPGGRLVFCEPALTVWSKLIYGKHHEIMDVSWDLFGLDKQPPEADPNHTFANIAISEKLFFLERKRTLAEIPALRLVSAKKFAFVLYPLTGGFSYRSLVPHFGYKTLMNIEDVVCSPFAGWLTGMRMLVVLEKTQDAKS